MTPDLLRQIEELYHSDSRNLPARGVPPYSPRPTRKYAAKWNLCFCRPE